MADENKNPTRADQDERIYAEIDRIYDALQGHFSYLRNSETQRNESKALVTCGRRIVEAPTGSGKTLTYLVPMIAKIFLNRGVSRSFDSASGYVVSTATKLLQTQVLNELKKFVAIGYINENEFSVIKGKENYFCIKSFEGSHAKIIDACNGKFPTYDSDEITVDLFPELEFKTDDLEERLIYYRKMSSYVDSEYYFSWDGDFLNLPPHLSKNIPNEIKVSDACGRKKCSYADECKFMHARSKLEESSLFVVNHALLLNDISAKQTDFGSIIPAGSYHLVVDEAHQLPSYAISENELFLSEKSLTNLNKKSSVLKQIIFKNSFLNNNLLKQEHLSPSDLELSRLVSSSVDIFKELETYPVDESKNYRFHQGRIPDSLRDSISKLLEIYSEYSEAYSKIKTAMSKLKKDNELSELEKKKLSDVSFVLNSMRKSFSSLGKLGYFLRNEATKNPRRRMCKWISRENEETKLHISAISAAPFLINSLWHEHSPVVSCAMYSATICQDGNFDYFSDEIGIDFCGSSNGTRTYFSMSSKEVERVQLPYVFDYKKSNLNLFLGKLTPNISVRDLYEDSLPEKFEKYVELTSGNLAIFQSNRLLNKIAPILKQKFGEDFVKVQGQTSLKILLEKHKQDVDSGRGSLLLGLHLMAEGLDLPGNYCKKVFVSALPFEAAGNPVEEEWQEILGTQYFGERALINCIDKLKQIVGRLNRSIFDTGDIYIFDPRILTSFYGSKIIRALPPFTKNIIK